jgi:hypothetical protein
MRVSIWEAPGGISGRSRKIGTRGDEGWDDEVRGIEHGKCVRQQQHHGGYSYRDPFHVLRRYNNPSMYMSVSIFCCEFRLWSFVSAFGTGIFFIRC